MDAPLKFFDSDWSKGHFKFNSFYHKEDQPDKEKINDCRGDQRKESLVGSPAHDVAHSGKVCNRNITDDRGFFNKTNQLAFNLRKSDTKCLRQNNKEECLIGVVAQSSCALFLSLAYCRNTGGQNIEHSIAEKNGETYNCNPDTTYACIINKDEVIKDHKEQNGGNTANQPADQTVYFINQT